PKFFSGAGGAEPDEKDLGRAAARLATGAIEPTEQGALPVPNTVIATFLTEGDCKRAKTALTREKLRAVHQGGETRLVINVEESGDPGDALEKIAEIPGLLRLEEKKIPRLHNNVARDVIGAGVVSANPSGLGLTGKGELAAVADTGLDTGIPATI